MNFHTAKDFIGKCAWDALDIATIEGASVRLHWSSESYIWHINDGAEVFVLLDGEVVMKSRQPEEDAGVIETATHMKAGDICYAAPGDEHVAEPIGEARMLVIEKIGSI